MKKIATFLSVFAVVTVISLSASFAGGKDTSESALYKIYFTNKCSKTVKVYAKQPGQATYYTVEAGYKKPYSFNAGTKFYDEGDHFLYEVTTSSEGHEVIVCQ